MTIDDNALYRQPELAALRPDEDERERAAREAGVTYLTLDGDIGVLGNGAGLVMSTLDLIGAAGGRAADFCDVGGGARAERIAAALGIVASDARVRALLINIFGGITRGDEVARGVLAWRQQTGVDLPLVVRLDGINAEEGRLILQAAGVAGLRSTDNALGGRPPGGGGRPGRGLTWPSSSMRRAASWSRASPAARAASTPSACWPPAPGSWPA